MRRSSSLTAARLVVAGLLLAAAQVTAAGPKAYVGNYQDNTVSVIDIGTGSVVATVPVSAGPHGMIATPDGATLYVSGDGSSEVSIIDTATDRVTGRIAVGRTPHGLAMTPDGKLLLVGVYGEDRVAFVDTATRSVVASVPVPKPHTIAIRPDGKLAYVASQEPGAFGLVVIDLATRTRAGSLPLAKPPRDLEFGQDGRALYFTLAGVDAIEVLDPASDRIIAEIPTGVSPHVAKVFQGAPSGVAVVQGPGVVELFDPARNVPVGTVAVGKQPHWMAATADGKRLYVTNEGSNDVTVVDLVTHTTSSIPVGHAPRKVVVVQAAAPGHASAKRVSIAKFAFAPEVVEIAPGGTVEWTNDDGAPHGLAFRDGARGADLLLPGASFERTYETPGTFAYACAVHPFMTGKVVVRP